MHTPPRLHETVLGVVEAISGLSAAV